MTKKNTKKALVLSVLSLVVCFSMLVGTTFAWFTDSVTSANNVIASGNLDVVLEYWDGTDWADVAGEDEIFDPTAKWEPGYADVVYFRISNAGSLAMQYSFVMNVANPGRATNVDGQEFELADYLKYSIVEGATENQFGTDRAAAIAAATADGQVPRALSAGTAERVTSDNGTALASGASVQFAVVVWMPETVGNEANYRGTAPEIELTFNVIATQATSESDGFGTDYDAGADLGDYSSGTANLPDGASAVEVVAVDAAGYNKGSATVPAGALAQGVTQVKMSVDQVETNPNITINDGMTAETYEVKVEGIKDGNTVPVMAQIKINAGLNPNTVKLYHYDTEIACTYDPETGYVTFETTSFSPFTVVYDADSKYVAPEAPEGQYPTATVTYESQYVNTEIEWGNYGQWSPTAGLDSNLEAAFTFACPDYENATDAEKEIIDAYRYWNCDFYVSLDKALGEDQLFLGGNYGSFGWVGFHNGELTLDANTEIGLLESVTTKPWTYNDVETYVGEFICGVGDVNDALNGATFTVKLRLTNPDNTAEYYDVNVVTYTFGGDSVIDGNTVVITAADLQDAFEEGGNVVLGGDIDLNDLLNP